MSTDKMTPTPWSIWEGNATFIISDTSSERNPFIAQATDIASSVRRWPENAKAIVSAINNTYGAGIDPEAVKDLRDALTELMRFKHAIRDYAAPALQFDGNLIRALDAAEAAIEKTKL